MKAIIAFLSVVFCMLSANAMAESRLEIDQFGEARITNEASIWKNTGVTVSQEAEQYPLELIFSAVNASGRIIPVEQFTRQIAKGFNLTTEDVAKTGLLCDGNQVIVVHNRLVNSKTGVNPFYYLIPTSGGLLLLAAVLWDFAAIIVIATAMAAFATAMAAAAFALGVTIAALDAATIATIPTIAAFVAAVVAALATVSVFTAAANRKKLNWWHVARFFFFSTVSAVFMYFGT